MVIPQAVVATGNGKAQSSVVEVSFWATRGSGAAADIVILSVGGRAFRQSFALGDSRVRTAAADLAFDFFSSGGPHAAADLVRSCAP